MRGHPGVARVALPVGSRSETNACPTRVLLVSYVEDERIMYDAALRAAGLDVYACADPAAAINALSWRPDVVVTRILQPGAAFDGFELVRRIRRHQDARHAAMIGLTSLVGTFQSTMMQDTALDALLLLPCDPYQLIAHIQTALERRSERARQRDVAATIEAP
jgi:CheY-like chemotaxis protein